jgi:hypothetical protein
MNVQQMLLQHLLRQVEEAPAKGQKSTSPHLPHPLKGVKVGRRSEKRGMEEISEGISVSTHNPLKQGLILRACTL